ncbi:GNAT family N-acetyltransferase [Rhizobium sp. SSA_523]|uniref:GNAT family N-acetyltransferase n=1 Tax=Rhizobium sp. SSA_523 TaxID=2952477 RepID=UPI00209181A4|nr:GNAT family N-acetyltransferase [Rhizobium sp. SSA_523]MCO5733928.1 GNAT family N-acetyltransferase [Rhizobium sp. SSA_523]WKC24809.1 GNAT family N-acetyltransferase [Rhizobium sp. SSA_523]
MNDDLTLRVASSFLDIAPDQWSRLSGTRRGGPGPYNPFLSQAFLSALEQSGCATTRTGWLAHHLLLEDAEGALLGAVPGYLKSHSQGEYVFDHAWADAFERAGGQYYPKLQCTIPFTPATGPRLLVRGDQPAHPLQATLSSGLAEVTRQLGVSSAHVTFLPEEELPFFEEAGFLHRTDQQFHFINRGYGSHDDFLAELSSAKRKNLRKERRTALENGISIDWLTGADLTEEIWDQFFAFYMDTGSRKWGRPYLNREFYSLIGERMAEDILLVMAKRDGRYIAGAINFIGDEVLFGRHWGCIEDHPFLHFEVCYHQAIDFALAHKLKRVEAGAQGQHKLARGYLPVTTHSAHYITHPGLRRAVADYLKQERREVEYTGEIMTEHSPFRKGERQEPITIEKDDGRHDEPDL